MKYSNKIVLPAIALMFYSNIGFSCGYCDGDKAAAVYSEANKITASVKKWSYVVVEALNADTEEKFESVVGVLKTNKNIDKESILSAYDQRSISFLYMGSFDFASFKNEMKKFLPEVSFKDLRESKKSK